jgi:hypothetical protein
MIKTTDVLVGKFWLGFSGNYILAIYAPRALERWLRPENDESNSRALAREMDIVRWRRGAYKILLFTTCSLKKKKLASLQLWIDEGVMNLLRPIIPGCYGQVYVFRILGVMQLY